MRIGILTQPLRENYGGLLQNLALQTVLKQMGHEVWTIHRQYKRKSFIDKLVPVLKRFILRYFMRRKDITSIILFEPTKEEAKIIGKNTIRFIKENIQITDRIDSDIEISFLGNYKFDALIVGSDQVWRPAYSPCITNYFLDFAVNESTIKRVAYAASFGVDNWEFSSKQTTQCASLVKSFNAISVREDSAIRLCKEKLGVDVVHVLDPTMLLTKEDYIKLVEKDNIPKIKGNLMTYVLDKSPENTKIIQKIAKELELSPFSVMPEKTFSEVGKKHLKDCIFLPVTQWIRGFMDADFIVTDSFHGTAFSIIFNKPFISVGNTERGITRFTSLLKMFGLEERLILSVTELTPEKIRGSIDFNRVNQQWDKEQQKALKFISKSLN